jgi:hypothetical protein
LLFMQYIYSELLRGMTRWAHYNLEFNMLLQS